MSLSSFRGSSVFQTVDSPILLAPSSETLHGESISITFTFPRAQHYYTLDSSLKVSALFRRSPWTKVQTGRPSPLQYQHCARGHSMRISDSSFAGLPFRNAPSLRARLGRPAAALRCFLDAINWPVSSKIAALGMPPSFRPSALPPAPLCEHRVVVPAQTIVSPSSAAE